MRGVIGTGEWPNPAVFSGSVKCGSIAGLLGLLAIVGWTGAATAQTLAPAQAGIEAPVTIRKPAQGVPESQVGCRWERGDDRPSLRCTIRFETPIDVVRATVVDATDKDLEWTPVFRPFDPTEDDTAFYVLIDRRTARQAEMRDLSDIFARARGKQQVAISIFANDLTRLQPFTTDRSAIANAFGKINQGGSASELLRHSLEAVRQLQSVSAPRKVLLIASSGRSDDTAYSLDEVIKLAQGANVRIVALGYVEQTSDSPNLQILERMSNQTGGFYYKSDLRRPLPQDVRNTILTRFSAGGVLNATAPSRKVPTSLEVTLRHSGNLISSFAVALAGAPADASSIAPQDTGLVENVRKWLRSLSNTKLAAMAGLLILLAAVVAILLVKRSRRTSELEPMPLASVEEVRKNLSAQAGIAPSAEPPPEPPKSEPAPDVIQKVNQAPAQGVPIAWLEFNSAPGRVAVRRKHVTIGREADNDIVTDANEDTVSRHHAAISVNTNGRFQISNRSREYRHTPNPIWINDKEMEHAELCDGDRVRLGTGSYGFVFVEVR
ncbi:FHA domain-containing protein [Bradyrhizobium sp. 180]|uniref:FHA domain-containing protein n=1 Tax=Bradyrhizobium sp. 180 TaxID=2782650 RepID=UPI001FF9AD41|nr:FHA domain-containing protein [Bradyrhizobium sp. 180]MCK1489748.1 FHA domain-containing protein [Bradyrhizobium sp. 180]